MHFDYLSPKTVDEAIALRVEYGESAVVINGGTDVIPKLKGGAISPEHLIGLKEIEELKQVTFDPEDGLRIGATVTLRHLETMKEVQELYPAFCTAMRSMSNTQTRNIATPIGNIINAVPSADTAAPLIALGAEIVLKGPKGERTLLVEDFMTGVLKTLLAPDEIATQIHIPAPAKGSKNTYKRYSVRKALDLAMVGVAASLLLDEDGVCQDIRIALNAVAVKPKRAENAEAMLLHKKLTRELIEEAAACASINDCAPISDVRASREYRTEQVRLRTRDALLELSGI